MDEAELARARQAALAVAASLGLPADDSVVVFNSNKLALRLRPYDVLARVTRAELRREAHLELDRAQRLAAAGCPVGSVLPDVDPVVHERDGFAVTLWSYYDPADHPVRPHAYAQALTQLHAGMRTADLAGRRFTDRIAEAQRIAADPNVSPDLTPDDRELLASRLADLRRTIEASGAVGQLLHGEPHPGNVLGTTHGPVFVDFETLCRGPLELDLAHVPPEVCEHYPGLDRELLDVCRQLVLAMIAAWRWDDGDAFPRREYWRHALLHALREGLPWPAPDGLIDRQGADGPGDG